MRLGLDFGTTNSTVALYDGSRLHPLIVDPANDNPYIAPSLIYIDRHGGQPVVGVGAANAYLESETGRPVRWRQREAGEIELTVASFSAAPIDFIQNFNVLVDEAANGRLLQSIKTALFNERYEGTQVFDTFYRIDDLIAIVLRFLKTAAESQLKRSCEQIVLGRPVSFSDNPLADSRAESILLRAAYLAGFRDVALRLEPVGIAHLYHQDSDERQTVLIFDFGGGTLDLTIAALGGAQPPEILATEGVLVGGDDLDRRIMELLLPHFGAGEHSRLPPEIADKLVNWQTMPELSQPQYLVRIKELQRESSNPKPYLALETLVARNLGFKLFKEIERAKQQLSSADSVTLAFDYGETIHIRRNLTRRRFDRLINREIDQVEAGLERVLAQARIEPGQVDRVLRTGGSSQVPAFKDLLGSIFGTEKQEPIDPLTSVVGGFAVSAYQIEQTPVNQPAPHNVIRCLETYTGREAAVHRIGLERPCYVDRNFTVNRIPAALDDLPAIQPDNRDHVFTGERAISFTLDAPRRVYVAYESTVRRLPSWLRGYELEDMQIELLDDFALIARTMRVYSRVFPAGQVILGGNQARGYSGNVILNYLVLVEA